MASIDPILMTLSLTLVRSTASFQLQPYAMYVWRDGWDSSVPGCNSTSAFYNWSPSNCFTHSWNSPAKRQWLWSTCLRPGRRVSHIYMFDSQVALASRNCSNPGIRLIQETLLEGHTRVPGLQVYALFSDGGDDVPEQSHVTGVVWYNKECTGGDPLKRFDGVAVNNENWNNDWSPTQMTAYLDNLNGIRVRADAQSPPGSLQTHFSVGWNWGRRQGKNGDIISVTWRGKTRAVMRHFIDIFHHLDVQVAFVTAEAIEFRIRGAEWAYAVQQGKPLQATAYINKAYPCQVTFFPFPLTEPECVTWSQPYKSESAMFQQLDDLEKRVDGLKISLHYFRGAYSSGGHPDWPRH